MDGFPSFKYECALCGATIARDARTNSVDAVQVTRDGADADGMLTHVRLAGRRMQAMALGDALPRDILFVTCGDACRTRLFQEVADAEDASTESAPTPVRRGRMQRIRAGEKLPFPLTGSPGATALQPAPATAPAAAVHDDVRLEPPSARDRRQAELIISDRCAWCLGPMPEGEGEFQMLFSHINNPPPDYYHHVVNRIQVGQRPVYGWPVDADMPDAPAGANIVFTLCSHGCSHALEAAVEADPNSGHPETPGPPAGPYVPTREERELAFETIESVCAWCGRDVVEDDRVIGVFARFREGTPADVPEDERILAVSIGGRNVPGFVARPGSQVSVEGWHVGFQLCGPACATALSEGIADDNLLTIVH